MRRGVAVLVVLLGAVPLRAQAPPGAVDEARRLFEEAIAAVSREDYAAALGLFERSQRLNPKPVTLFNIGMCQRALADLPAAYATFRTYLATAPDDVPERRVEAERVTAEIDAVLARVTVRATEAWAEVLVDGRPVEPPPSGEPLRLMAGTHVFEARADGFVPARQVADLAPGQTVDIVLPLAAEPQAGEDEDSGGVLSSWWFWTIVGAVAVGAGVTAGVLLWPAETGPSPHQRWLFE